MSTTPERLSRLVSVPVLAVVPAYFLSCSRYLCTYRQCISPADRQANKTRFNGAQTYCTGSLKDLWTVLFFFVLLQPMVHQRIIYHIQPDQSGLAFPSVWVFSCVSTAAWFQACMMLPYLGQSQWPHISPQRSVPSSHWPVPILDGRLFFSLGLFPIIRYFHQPGTAILYFIR